jgi:hypothetical protein
MRYLEPLVGFLAFLWLSIGSLLSARGIRDWQQKAQILLGLSGMSLFGLILYERYSLSTHAFYSLKALLAGIAIGIFVTLWLEGSLNVLIRLKSSRAVIPAHTSSERHQASPTVRRDPRVNMPAVVDCRNPHRAPKQLLLHLS